MNLSFGDQQILTHTHTETHIVSRSCPHPCGCSCQFQALHLPSTFDRRRQPSASDLYRKPSNLFRTKCLELTLFKGLCLHVVFFWSNVHPANRFSAHCIFSKSSRVSADVPTIPPELCLNRHRTISVGGSLLSIDCKRGEQVF